MRRSNDEETRSSENIEDEATEQRVVIVLELNTGCVSSITEGV